MKFQVNVLFEYIGNGSEKWIERILYIDPGGQNLVKIHIFNPRALPTWQPVLELEQALAIGDIRILEQDPLKRLHALEGTLPELHRKHRDRAWEGIKSLVLDEYDNPRVAIFVRAVRGHLVAIRSQETNVTRQTIYTYLRQYWQNGQTRNSLLPAYDRCGGKGKERRGGEQKLGRPSALARVNGDDSGVIIDDEIEKRFERGVRLFYENQQRMPLTKAFQRTLETYFNRGYELQDGVLVPVLPPAGDLPTFRQFQYWYSKHQNLERATKSRLTERRFNLSYRPILGDATQMAFGPGSIFQIDATVADIYLVSSLDPGRIIGRPVLYIVTDVFSRMVAGFSVGLESPGWLGAMLALENVTTDKVAFCAEHGIMIASEDWPIHHLPKEILADRGEMEGYNADQLVNGLGVKVSNTAPYRAEWKAIVERNFRLVNDQLVHWMPGAVYPRRERGEKDYRLDACLNLPQFRSLLIRLFLFHNRFHELKDYRRDEAMLQDHVEPYPLDLWNWGLRNRVGQLRQMDQEIIRLNLLPEAEASVTEKGILFRQRQYDSQVARDEQWYLRARANGRWKIKVAYDPRRVDVIYLRLANGQRLEPCLLHPNERAFQGRDWYEILDLDELERQKEPTRRSRNQQAEAILNAQVANIVDPAQEKALAEREGQTRSSALQGILENRWHEREAERKTGAWELAPSGELTRPEQPDETEDQAGYIPPPHNIELLRKLDEELRKDE
jgi:putative transposase